MKVRLGVIALVVIVVCGVAGEASADTGEVDARLSQKISYETWHTPLKTILADLSQITGVTLKAGYNLQDWQVRDRKMNIYVKDVSLAQLMSSIARVMKFKWSKSDKTGEITYRLCADYKLIGSLQAEANRRQNELKREASRRRAELLDQLEKLSDASDADIQNLKQENPYLYTCAETGFAKLVTQIFDEMPRLRDNFLSGEKNVIFRFSTLPPHIQQFYGQVLRNTWKYDSILRGTDRLADDMESELVNVPTTCVHMALKSWPNSQLSNFGSVMTVLSTGHHVLGQLRSVESEVAKLQASGAIAAADSGTNNKQFYEQLSPKLGKARQKDAEEAEYYLMYDPVAEHPDQPDLHRKITVNITEEARKNIEEQAKILGGRAYGRLQYQAALKAVADAAKMGIVSDSFNVLLGNYDPDGKEDDFINILDSFSGNCKCNWDKHGAVLEIRRRDWFRRRASQIPDEWAQAWRDELNQTGTMQLDSFARMVALSEEQRDECIFSDPLLGEAAGLGWVVENNEGFLRFYLKLTPSQRKMLFTENGLNPRMLKYDQQQAYADMFHYGRRHTWDTEVFTEPSDSPVKITTFSHTTEDDHLEHSFIVTLEAETGEKKDYWHVKMPKITQPERKVNGS